MRGIAPTKAGGSGAVQAASAGDLGVHENPLLSAAAAAKVRTAATPAPARDVSLEEVMPRAASTGDDNSAAASASAARARVLASYASTREASGGASSGVSMSAAERVQLSRTLSVHDPSGGGLAVIDGAGRRGFAAKQLASAPASSEAAPPGWSVRFSRSRRLPYYVNNTTGESSWTLPDNASDVGGVAAAAAVAGAADEGSGANAESSSGADADVGSAVAETHADSAAHSADELHAAPSATADGVSGAANPEAEAWAAEAALPPLPHDVFASWSSSDQCLYYTGADGVTTWDRPLPAVADEAGFGATAETASAEGAIEDFDYDSLEL